MKGNTISRIDFVSVIKEEPEAQAQSPVNGPFGLIWGNKFFPYLSHKD